jgi:ferrous iron transport protein B
VSAAASSHVRLGLIGSPNSGKTTLFNALTGLRARVGNYPGVTVERREGEVRSQGARVRVIDLPGTYSLTPLSEDEAVVARVLEGRIAEVPPPDGLVLTVDATSLERSLVLVAEVLRLERPVCLVLTMMDELAARGGRIDIPKLTDALGVPVLGVVGHRGLGVGELRKLLPHPERWSRPPLLPPAAPRDRDAWLASVLARVLSERPGPSRRTEAIDRVVLHPISGTLLFGVVMVTFFQLIFAWATPAMDAIDVGIAQAGEGLRSALPAGLVREFLVDGLVAGVGSVVVFLPQILLLFTMLHLLEDLGYMARAAFVVDRAMGRVGLEGRASTSACSRNVPSIAPTSSCQRGSSAGSG